MASAYLDFDLLLEPVEGGYRARVLSSPAGQAQAELQAAVDAGYVEPGLARALQEAVQALEGAP